MLPLVAFAVLSTPSLTFVRHGETEANATGRYNAKTLNKLSAKGLQQVASLTEQLKKEPRFDLILVSPSPRAVYTIAPYLRATHQTAYIWPLLYECCTGKHKASKPTNFTWGPKIHLPKEWASNFKVLAAMDRLPNSPDFASGLAQVEATVLAYKRDYSRQRVLLVGHSGHGGQFIHALTGKWKKVDNATIMHILPDAR